jgi:hypothetical protein
MTVYSNGSQQENKGNWNYITVASTETNGVSTWINGIKQHPTKEDFIPTKVIYNNPLTICYFPDGTRVIVRCAEDEEYIKETGVMACITKKVMSRSAFKKLVVSGQEQFKPKELPETLAENMNFKKALDDFKNVLIKYKKDQWG